LTALLSLKLIKYFIIAHKKKKKKKSKMSSLTTTTRLLVGLGIAQMLLGIVVSGVPEHNWIIYRVFFFIIFLELFSESKSD